MYGSSRSPSSWNWSTKLPSGVRQPNDAEMLMIMLHGPCGVDTHGQPATPYKPRHVFPEHVCAAQMWMTLMCTSVTANDRNLCAKTSIAMTTVSLKLCCRTETEINERINTCMTEAPAKYRKRTPTAYRQTYTLSLYTHNGDIAMVRRVSVLHVN